MALMRVGLWSRILIAMAAVVGSGVIWLNIAGIGDQVFLAMLVVFLPGLFFIAIGIYAEKVRAVDSAPPDKMWMVVAIALVLNLVFSLLAAALIPNSTLFPQFNTSGFFPTMIIAVLFAVFEETHMMGLAVFLKTVGVPDLAILAISALWFPMMHGLAYQATWMMTAILAVGRVIFTSAALSTDNTDAGFLAHLLWNLGAVF